ncbi:uncharacterized protein MONBRDRAFT_15811 [Monosiga brevicollis MX1]|uniref:FAD dependent oxidoreductase domain-containing protein n=1 Tax=Monosiga brevicollis TaxID=81824 RepID=A9UUY0_MONBE|nr:uncharacterized protein MONBRDRAFT_15811 [Monosiga brevicollis MX1]EDQ90986.1 predicted protein [Monosiga brevicollis MX1]|eukprot:XP_001744283.1 hypothetical protein [Monosiga brevicollis MX1]
MDVAVIGGGVIGLSTALEIRHRVADAKITVIAEHYTPHTTSDGAGALWRPIFLQDTPEEDQRRWCKATYDYLMRIVRHGGNKDAGVFLCGGYDLQGTDCSEPYWKDMVFGFRHVSQSELRSIGGADWAQAKTAWHYTTIMIDSSTLLEYLMARCRERGIVFEQRKIESFEPLFEQYSVVVNCTGSGSRQLAQDDLVHRARGVTLHCQAPWLKHFLIASDLPDFGPGEFSHMFPRSEVAIVGGIKVLEDDRTSASADEIETILRRTMRMEPSLRSARVLKTWTGFRPVRSRVRLEAEEREHNGQRRCLIHNYGHGGSGLTIWQGCAEDAANLLVAWTAMYRSHL